MALWHRLVAHLAPDVIVISVRGHYRDQIAFADRLGWQPLLVFGPAAQQPFATLTQEARQRVGRRVREILDAR